MLLLVWLWVYRSLVFTAARWLLVVRLEPLLLDAVPRYLVEQRKRSQPAPPSAVIAQHREHQPNRP